MLAPGPVAGSIVILAALRCAPAAVSRKRLSLVCLYAIKYELVSNLKSGSRRSDFASNGCLECLDRFVLSTSRCRWSLPRKTVYFLGYLVRVRLKRLLGLSSSSLVFSSTFISGLSPFTKCSAGSSYTSAGMVYSISSSRCSSGSRLMPGKILAK